MKAVKKTLLGFAGIITLLSTTRLAWAAEEASVVAAKVAVSDSTLMVLFVAAAACVVIGAIIPGYGQGKAIVAACEGMARNPGVAGKIMTTMILGLAMMEALAIYSLVVALVLLLANPFV